MTTRDNLIDRIQASSKKNSTSMLGRIPVWITHPLPEKFKLDVVWTTIRNAIPDHFLSGIESIYIGNFKHLEERELDAAYLDGVIYVTNNQEDEQDMIDDIVHELAHSVEERYVDELYFDGTIEHEFAVKRQKLYQLLRAEGYDVRLRDFMNMEYSVEFDDLLYKTIGYPLLRTLSVNLFVSPYGATSLREYFANGFEAFFLNKNKELKDICPVTWSKIDNLVDIDLGSYQYES